MERPQKEQTFMEIASILAKRSTCKRRQVGCVLVDRNFLIIGSGYNGVGRGLAHCIDNPCPGSELPSGVGLETCEAIHAEQNALLQCKEVANIRTAYCTSSPCMHCAKLFLNTGVKTIYYTGEPYSVEALDLLHSADIYTERL